MREIDTVLFDLDGTLLPMDNDAFTKGYFKLLAAAMMLHGYEPQKLVDSIWAGTAAMVKNDGSRTNEEAFWACVYEIYGDKIIQDKALFERFYAVDFQQARSFCGYSPAAAQCVREAQAAGMQVVLATNPIFPAVATESRIRWAGLEPEEFALYTTYENTGYCKPNPAYYRDLIRRLSLDPQRCLMVGNDVSEDMEAASAAGMQVFLLTDCLINRKERDIRVYPNGGFDELREMLSR